MRPYRRYENIYKAARNQDETTISSIVNEGVSLNPLQIRRNRPMTPVCQLAFENEEKAVDLLLKNGASERDAVFGYALGGHKERLKTYLKNSDNKDSAVRGYAASGYVEEVNKLLANGASIAAAIEGYAMGGNVNQVTTLLKKEDGSGESRDDKYYISIRRGRLIDLAVCGYAIGGHADMVSDLLQNGASEAYAVYGYALAGRSENVELLQNNESNNSIALYAYAAAGHMSSVEALIADRRNASSVAYGYAYGGHTDQVNEFISNEGYDYWLMLSYGIGGHIDQVNNLINLIFDAASKRFYKPIVKSIFCKEIIDDSVYGFAAGDHTDLVSEQLAKGARIDKAIRGYADSGRMNQIDRLNKIDITLLKKIYELDEYGKDLKVKGHLTKGNKVVKLATDLRYQINTFNRGDCDSSTASEAVSKLLSNGKRMMGEDRTFKDIIAHIILALTGIGLIIILCNKYLSNSKSIFLNPTKRQKILGVIEERSQNIFKIKHI